MKKPSNGHYPIRCPLCHREMLVNKKTDFSRIITCEDCHQGFEFRNALPPIEQHTVESEATVESTQNSRENIFTLLFGIPGVLLFIIWSCSYHQHLSGPEFLGFIIIIFLVTYAGELFLRIHWHNPFISILGFAVFEGISIHRLVWGYHHGMHNFDILLIMMVPCGFAYFIGVKNLFSNSSKTDHHGGGSGGSKGSGSGGCGCGGGCGDGCGGGCGGCGGCGD